MPSNQWHTQARPHLCDILSLYPDQEPFCAGYAPSQGRRCHCRTNARGRKTATALLNEGTRYLYAGWCIDDLLEDVAPHVLCTRFHQNQAMSLAAKWQRQVDRFWNTYTYIPPTPVREQRRTAKAPTPLMSRHDLEEGSSRMSRSLQGLLSRLERERLAVSQEQSHSGSRYIRPEQNVNATGSRPADSESRRSGRPATARSTVPTPPPAPPVNVASTARAVSIPSPRTPATTTTSSTSSTTLATSTRPATLATRATAISIRAPSPSVPRVNLPTTGISISPRTKHVTRRPIKGDCGICLESLRKVCSGQHNKEDGEGEEKAEGDDDEDDEDDEGDEEVEISWCKAQCGVNYHTTCIKRWLKSCKHYSCPTCRSRWRH
ncbi:hypothetical protein BDV06DRAFT_195770 [Aspergillus oleicola]